jgi:hypothetical protein
VFPGDAFPKDFFPGDYFPPVEDVQPIVPPVPRQRPGRIVLADRWLIDQEDEDLLFWVL